MRHSLIDLVKKTIILKFNLPYGTINRTSISSLDDFCYETKSNEELAELIYYSIVDYCLNNSEINLTDLNADQKFSIKNRLRYDENDDESTKLKYGFFGECLLNVILNVHFHTDKIIARGLLYSATDKRETTGYDCFHIIHSPNNSLIELWLGEVKMHLSFSSALETILTNLSNALSYKYLDSNFSVIFNREKDIDNQLTSLKFINLIKKWKNNQLNLKNEIINNSLKIVYPMFIFYDDSGEYESIIANNIKNIEKRLLIKKHNNEISAELFFCFFPQNSILNIKKQVLSWILDQKQVI